MPERSTESALSCKVIGRPADNMEVNEALSQIAEIHRHIARTEYYRGYRSVTMAMTGTVAILGGVAQPWIVPQAAPAAFVRYWMVLATFNLIIVCGEILIDYLFRLSPRQRRLARCSVSQFVPCLAAGVVCTLACSASPSTIALLPGLWCILFCLGAFASRPYLPHGVGWVGVYYLLAAGVLFALMPSGQSLAPWGMGTAFSGGQLFLAAVLYCNHERPSMGGHEPA